MRNRWKAALVLTALCMAAGHAHAGALRNFSVGMFAVGAGMSFGSAYVGSDAARVYDQYMTTARQSDMLGLHDDYAGKRRMSDRLSSTGAGLMAFGALLGVYSVVIEPPQADPGVGMAKSASVREGLAAFLDAENRPGAVWRRRF